MKILDNVKFNDTLLDVTIGTGGAPNTIEADANIVLGRGNSISLISGGGEDTPAAAGGIKVPGEVTAGKAKATSGVFANLSASAGSAILGSANITNLTLSSAKSEYSSEWKYPSNPVDGSQAVGNLTLKTSGVGRIYMSGTRKTWSVSGYTPGWTGETSFDDYLINVEIASGIITTSGDPPASGYTRYPEISMSNVNFDGYAMVGPFHGGVVVKDKNGGDWFKLELTNNGDGTATASWTKIKS